MEIKTDKEKELELLIWCIKELRIVADTEGFQECDNNAYSHPCDMSATISMIHKAKSEGFWYAISLLEEWYEDECKELLP